ARNYIGYTQDSSVTPTHTTSDTFDKLQLNHGDTVQVAAGVRAGDIYQYLGDSINVQHSSKDGYKYDSADGTVTLKHGDRVKVASNYDSNKGVRGDIYQYKGGLANPVDLSSQDYTHDTSHWQHVGSNVSTSVNPNDLVQLSTHYDKTKGTPGGIYKYTGG